MWKLGLSLPTSTDLTVKGSEEQRSPLPKINNGR